MNFRYLYKITDINNCFQISLTGPHLEMTVIDLQISL